MIATLALVGLCFFLIVAALLVRSRCRAQRPKGQTERDNREEAVIAKDNAHDMRSDQGDFEIMVAENADLFDWAKRYAKCLCDAASGICVEFEQPPCAFATSDSQRQAICDAVRKGVKAGLRSRSNVTRALFLCAEYFFNRAPSLGKEVGIRAEVLIELFTIGSNATKSVLIGPRILLRGISRRVKGQVWESASTLRVGRCPTSNLALDSGWVSRRHAEICYSNNVWSVKDLGSTNGTFVNGKKIGPGDWPIKKFDVIRFGKVAMAVEELVAGEHRLPHETVNVIDLIAS